MAYATGSGYHTSGATMNNKRSHYQSEDDDAHVLDPSILDYHSPTDAQPRKPSLVHSHAVITPVEGQGWNTAYGAGLPVQSPTVGASHTLHDSRNSFSGQAQPPLSTLVLPPHPGPWPFEHGSGHCTPTHVTDIEFAQPAPPGYEHAQYVHHRNDSARGSLSHPGPWTPHIHQGYHVAHPDGHFSAAAHVQTPMSPHSHQDWKAINQQESEAMEIAASVANHLRSRPTKELNLHASHLTSVEKQRISGIRKKNGRIDIPSERDIHTIDLMLEDCKNEEEQKELKQQKRLLRNREAA